ncbi:MAG TPA: pseudouridine synthase [Verrucomicrobiae bacterium]|nr:pseudouridine synthase [Verrucomicrobiae bacterium]
MPSSPPPADTPPPEDKASSGEASPAIAGGERIAKRIARAGLCSRREAEAWIAEGRVIVDGHKITSPALVVGPASRIVVDGKPLPVAEPTRLFRYHKPRGLLTTAHDPEGRETIYDKLPRELPRLMPIGRLDLTSEGLLLLTNDGELKRRLELPVTGWLRRYRVRVNGRVEPARLAGLEKGVTIEGIDYGPIRASLDRQQGDNAWLTLSLAEGKNREIRRVCEFMGYPVNRLIRTAYGPFQLGHLERGEVEEVPFKVLRDQLGLAAPSREDRDRMVRPIIRKPHPEGPRPARSQPASTPAATTSHAGERRFDRRAGAKPFTSNDRPGRRGEAKPYAGNERPDRRRETKPYAGERRSDQRSEAKPYAGQGRPERSSGVKPYAAPGRLDRREEAKPHTSDDRPERRGRPKAYGGVARPEPRGEAKPYAGERRFDRGGGTRPYGGKDRLERSDAVKPHAGPGRPNRSGGAKRDAGEGRADRRGATPHPGDRQADRRGPAKSHAGGDRPDRRGEAKPHAGHSRPERSADTKPHPGGKPRSERRDESKPSAGKPDRRRGAKPYANRRRPA